MQSATKARSDKFTLSYSIWVAIPFFLFFYSHELDRIFNLYMLLAPIIFIPAFFVAIIWCVCLIWNAFARRWRRIASLIAAPIFAYSFFAGLNAFGIDPHQIRFTFTRHYYLAKIAELPQTGAPRTMTFEWGETGGVAVANIFYRLVYDESDKVPLLRTSDSPRYFLEVRKMDRHFYLVTETYQ